MAAPPSEQPGDSDAGPRRGAMIRVKLPCASLDEVRARNPELKQLRFQLRTREPRAVGSRVRLETTLSDGTPCFSASAFVESVTPGSDGKPGGWTLRLAALDDRGQELVAWMGGLPPLGLYDPRSSPTPPPAPPVQAAVPKVPPQVPPPPAPTPARTPAPVPPAPPTLTPPPLRGRSWSTAAASPAPPAAPPSVPPPAPPPIAAGPPASPPARPAVTPPPARPAVTPPPARPAVTPPPVRPAVTPPPRATPTAAPATPPPPRPTSTPAAPPTATPPPLRSAPGASTTVAPPAPAQAATARPPDGPPPAHAAAHPAASRRPEPPRGPPPALAKPPTRSAAPVVEEDVAPEPGPAARGGRIIGIDLGTTNSAAAVVKGGKPFIIPSREGYSTIPSVVALSEKGSLIVGHVARDRLLVNPRGTVQGAKRLIGRQFHSPVVRDLAGRFSYEIVAGPRGEAAVKLGDRIYSLQKISSMVLAQVKQLAEQWLGEEVGRAVITVPAYYNDNQRQAVRAAGALAGLQVERIVNEPTAAALAFAHGRAIEQRVMVYDLGGGTFDTSVLELHGNVYEVIATGGDTFLGGVDFDKVLVDDLLGRFKAEHGVDFGGDRVAYQRIAEAAERVKIALSERLTAQVNLPFVTAVGSRAYALQTTVTRSELDALTRALVDRTLRVCDDVLTNAGLRTSDIGEVLLVGGQSRMPLVRSMIREFFGKEPSKSVHPDEAVALGAALLADSLQTSRADAPVLLDVLPMSIGIGQPGGRFKRVIERNTTLPCRRTHTIWTSARQGRTLAIPVFQGELEHAQDNEYLGTLLVADLPAGVDGDIVFDVTFTLSTESMLTVTAEERGTARSVTATFSTQDSPEAVRRRLDGEAESIRLPAPEEETSASVEVTSTDQPDAPAPAEAPAAETGLVSKLAGWFRKKDGPAAR